MFSYLAKRDDTIFQQNLLILATLYVHIRFLLEATAELNQLRRHGAPTMAWRLHTRCHS